MKYLLFILFGSLIFLPTPETSISEIEDMSVAELEAMLGIDFAPKKPNLSLKDVSAEAGRSLVHEGFAERANGDRSRKQSKHFVCTSCHNVVREDISLANPNPEARLDYTIMNRIPFLQGTTLYGAVNRSTYYNGDYVKKYGELVEPARKDIREAIQLCATECAQGRALQDWELESILAYLWEIELQASDLKLSDDEKQLIANAKSFEDKEQSLTLIRRHYSDHSPATFILPPADRKKGSGLVGRPLEGKKLYIQSCLHCHEEARYSFLHLDTTSLSLNYLRRGITDYSNHSIYQVTRWGVPSKSGKRSYMPQYPKEKMSEQQLADLRAYIEQ